MRKAFLITVIAFFAISYVHAQEVGLRFGDVSGGNVAIDGVFSTGNFSRIHADVSFGNGGMGIDALWDFLYMPLGKEAFNWYVGAGPYAFIGNDFALGAVGEIGLEYQFKEVPLVVGADWRPGLQIIDNTNLFAGGFGLNVRWVFGK
ncbi:outer membrane insertion C- signal [Labilibacter marinus]|uniref:outer membrane insertion C- signal n=1 Tax=Labilibacter marinus TaxID=1477105 RepID=UPI0008324C39|nr:outer membrane insertion C- signal [Labilibacter marinus]